MLMLMMIALRVMSLVMIAKPMLMYMTEHFNIDISVGIINKAKQYTIMILINVIIAMIEILLLKIIYESY